MAVRAKKRSGPSTFSEVYTYNCKTCKTSPLPNVMTPMFLASRHLRFAADRVHTDLDWCMIINALDSAYDLSGVSIWSTWYWERQHSRLQPDKALQPKFNKTAKQKRWSNSTRVLDDLMLEPVSAKRTSLYEPPSIFSTKLNEMLASAIASTLQHCSLLTCLSLNGVIFTNASLSVLARGIAKSKSLIALSISRCDIGDKGLSLLAPALRMSSALSRLDLSACNLTYQSGQVLSELLKFQAFRRVELHFPDTLRKSDAEIKQLLYHTRQSSSIKSVDNNNASNTSVAQLNDALVGMKRLTLCHNSLGDLGVMFLLDMLQNDVHVEVLDLQYNNITNEGAEAMLAHVENEIWRPMEILDLRNNDIDDSILQKIKTRLVLFSHKKSEKMTLYQFIADNPRNQQKPKPHHQWLDASNPLRESLHLPVTIARSPKQLASKLAKPDDKLTLQPYQRQQNQATGNRHTKSAWRPPGVATLPTTWAKSREPYPSSPTRSISRSNPRTQSQLQTSAKFLQSTAIEQTDLPDLPQKTVLPNHTMKTFVQSICIENALLVEKVGKLEDHMRTAWGLQTISMEPVIQSVVPATTTPIAPYSEPDASNSHLNYTQQPQEVKLNSPLGTGQMAASEILQQVKLELVRTNAQGVSSTKDIEVEQAIDFETLTEISARMEQLNEHILSANISYWDVPRIEHSLRLVGDTLSVAFSRPSWRQRNDPLDNDVVYPLADVADNLMQAVQCIKNRFGRTIAGMKRHNPMLFNRVQSTAIWVDRNMYRSIRDYEMVHIPWHNNLQSDQVRNVPQVIVEVDESQMVTVLDDSFALWGANSERHNHSSWHGSELPAELLKAMQETALTDISPSSLIESKHEQTPNTEEYASPFFRASIHPNYN